MNITDKEALLLCVDALPIADVWHEVSQERMIEIHQQAKRELTRIMEVDELLDALRPYAVNLSWKEVLGIWEVLLPEWAFLYVQHADKREALQMAYDKVRAEIAQEAE